MFILFPLESNEQCSWKYEDRDSTEHDAITESVRHFLNIPQEKGCAYQLHTVICHTLMDWTGTPISWMHR
jgi:hypothetical protein